MPQGLQGQECPGDAIGAAFMVTKIATGEIEDNKKSGRVRSGKVGAKARSDSMASKCWCEIARKVAEKRWT